MKKVLNFGILSFKFLLRIRNSLLGIFICLFVYSFIYIMPSFAKDGIEVSPSIIQLDLATDQPETTLTYTNHTSQSVILTFSASNISELDNGTNETLLQPKSAQDYQFGLSSWITFSNTSLILEPGAKDSITIFVNKDKLSPGGHYGSVLAQIQQTNPIQGIEIKTILATLVFVRAHTGKEYEKGSIATFAPEQNLWDFPTNFLFRFTNTGDTYVIPYGTVTIKDFLGNTMSKGILNQGSLMVLPQTLRRFEIPTSFVSSLAWPGIYHATITMHFGKSNQRLISTTTFFSFGTLPIAQMLIIILIGVGIYLFWRKRNKNKLT